MSDTVTLSSHDPLFSARIKVERAKRHVQEFQTVLKTFFDSSPYTVRSEDDPESGDQVFRFYAREPVPPLFAVVIGDAIHNIRAAYDNIIYAAVLHNNGTPTDSTGFPIYRDLKGLRSRGARKIHGISLKAARIFWALKPYKTGNSVLWELHRLDVTDKHKTIVPIWSRVRGVKPDFSSIMPAEFGDRWSNISLMLKPADKDPLNDGDEVYRVMKAARTSDREHNAEIVIEIAFGEDGVTGRSVVEHLHEQINFVQRVIDMFERRVFKFHL